MPRGSTSRVSRREKALVANENIGKLQRLIVSKAVNAKVDDSYARMRNLLELRGARNRKRSRVVGDAKDQASSVLAWRRREAMKANSPVTRGYATY